MLPARNRSPSPRPRVHWLGTLGMSLLIGLRRNSNLRTPRSPCPPNFSRSSQPHSSRFEAASKTPNKKSRREKKEQRRLKLGRNSVTPATSINTTCTSGAYNGGARNGGTRKDLSQLTCSNCRKKRYYAKNCPDPLGKLVISPATSTSRSRTSWERRGCLSLPTQAYGLQRKNLFGGIT